MTHTLIHEENLLLQYAGSQSFYETIGNSPFENDDFALLFLSSDAIGV